MGGASNITDFNLDMNVLSGSIDNLPNNSSIEIKVDVNAPTTVGGIAINAGISPPEGTTDVNISNNESIISIDVLDIPIDFSVVHSQISPTQGTGINAWNDFVTYEITITNNSSIAFPIQGFTGVLTLDTPFSYGSPVVQYISMECISTTNGTTCPDLSSINGSPIIVSSVQPIFSFGNTHEFTAGGSITFEVTYQYLDPSCAFELMPIVVDSTVNIQLEHVNVSSNVSNIVTTNLIESELCDLTDICIETIQTDPDLSIPINYGDEVTFETTVCNNGPLEAPIRFFLQNLTPTVQWDIISLNCINTTGNIACDDITLTDQDFLWSSNTFIMPVDATITVETVVIFLEPECATTTNTVNASVRSGTNLLSSQIFDSDISNNAETDFVQLPEVELCPSSDLMVTKIQIDPILPEGSSINNTTDWGAITYEITASNLGDVDSLFSLSDFIPFMTNQFVTGSLISVDCISTTGTANCFTIVNANIGVPQDGETVDGNLDVFWEILPEENRILPAQSSITFQVIIDWQPECSNSSITANNSVSINHLNAIIDPVIENNFAEVITYFAPCVDLIVQTFPEFTQVSINQNFDWIIDITNSTTSSQAINIAFLDTLDPNFAITGTPSCSVTSGNASCIPIPSFNIVNNTVEGTIPEMEAGSTIQVRIPVTAPSFGGAFSNTAEATPSPLNNEELTPETNISISNVQVIAPILDKVFNPETIFTGNTSLLTFTITNISSNPAQNNIAFTDNLPPNVFLAGVPFWENDNGCTATFTGDLNDTSVGVTNLAFPEGIANCSFSVLVTSNVIGTYLNDNTNFSDQNNIDTSQTSATLNVIEDNTNVDIEVLKEVFPQEVSIGDFVTFTITATNLGTTPANQIELFESLPSGYTFDSATTSLGIYDVNSSLWSIANLQPNQSETLTISVQVISSNNLLNTALLNSVFETDRDSSNNQDSAEVIINNCLNIPEGLSPNEDGKNDFLIIPCIEDYANNSIKIFNRYGTKVYEKTNYENEWNGKPNKGPLRSNTTLPIGTYYYVLELEEVTKPIIGWLYLNY